MEALHKNDTWEVTSLPSGRKAIGCKWVFKIKYKANGEVERYKARLVVKGFNQKEGIDYTETFASVAKMATVRCTMCIAVNNGWPMYQLDVNNAFLYGTLDESVYMVPPPGYFTKNENRVCKLKKSLYGLKQAPRKWNEKLTSVLIEFGFMQSLSDYSLFTKSSTNGFTVLLVYVDDILLTGSSQKEIEDLKVFMKSKFLIKDLGILKFFLGIEIIETDVGICMSQRKYCLELLHSFGMLGCKPVATPMDLNLVISEHGINSTDELIANITEYQKLIGKMIYLTITRPVISYPVQCLSQFMHSPRVSHLKLALRVLRYLKGAPGLGVSVSRSESLKLLAYVDSD